jgi:hypothetical protein
MSDFPKFPPIPHAKLFVMESNNRTRKIVFGSLGFASVGALLSSYFGPKVIAWYADPPVDIGVSCRSAIEWGMARLQTVQLGGLVVGLICGLSVMFYLTREAEG